MANTSDSSNGKGSDFKRFATKRIIGGILLTIAALWLISTLLGLFGPHVSVTETRHDAPTTPATVAHKDTAGDAQPVAARKPSPAHSPAAEPAHEAAQPAAPTHSEPATAHQTGTEPPVAAAAKTHAAQPAQATAPAHSAAPPAAAPAHGAHGEPAKTFPVKGMAFVDAAIKPLDHELNERFWGWRPNDILDFTDNVNNFQLGVLEVTRRTVVALTERLSRTGSTASFDPNLENAMNWFMIKADRYWFPSPEAKYRAGLNEMRTYFDKLAKGEANFYTRTDSLIPLLLAYEDLLGSCDENLVKMTEEDGSPVSYFSADDYFFYAKGVATAMYTVLSAALNDFSATMQSRVSEELLHHAVESLHHAIAIDPLLITNSDLGGILANHRANMAAPISHARFYVGLLAKALST